MSCSDNSDTENPIPSTSGCNTPPKKKRKPWYHQGFNAEWLNDPEFKEWLKPDANDKYVALCSVCDCKFRNTNRSGLLNHKSSSKHTKNLAAKKSSIKMQQFFSKKKTAEDPQDEVATAELLLSAFMAEHGMPFHQAEHLSELVKKMFPKCEVAQKMSMKKTKASYVMQEGIAFEERQEIAKICKENKFSIMIDESTDVSVSQVLAVMIRFFDKTKCKVTDALLDMIEVDDPSAEGLYKAVKELFASKGIPFTNIIGLACDNCSTMMGVNNGFQALLKKDIPSVFILGCICHSFALCSSHACAHLPSYLEEFLRNVCCYFSRSSKRQHEFSLIQEVVHSPKHKMLKLSQTRWLSRNQVISRILEQWDALQLFFQAESKTNKFDGAAHIYQTMTNRGTKHMLLFLNYILGKVDRMNCEFQSEYFRLSVVYTTIAAEYRSILGMFVKPEVLELEKLSQINPEDVSLHMNLEHICLGGRCDTFLLKEPLGDNEKRFRHYCKRHLVELCVQMRKRFPFDEENVLALLNVLDPKVALSSQRRIRTIPKLAVHFPNLVKEEELDSLQEQWEDLFHARSSLQYLTQSATCFWHELLGITDGNDQPKFDLLSKFMCNLLVLPHSSASVERLFSQMNSIKTKQTNRIADPHTCQPVVCKASHRTTRSSLL